MLYALSKASSRIQGIEEGLTRGDNSAIEDALAFLDEDPYYFRSGYERERVARWLSNAPMSTRQKQKARAIVLACVLGTKHTGRPGISRLAGAAANNAFREELRFHLRDSAHPAIQWRALHALLYVKRPGYTPDDIAAARAVALRRGDTKVAMRFLAPDWEAELRELVRHHDPGRAAAKNLLRYVDYRRDRRARMQASP